MEGGETRGRRAGDARETSAREMAGDGGRSHLEDAHEGAVADGAHGRHRGLLRHERLLAEAAVLSQRVHDAPERFLLVLLSRGRQPLRPLLLEDLAFARPDKVESARDVALHDDDLRWQADARAHAEHERGGDDPIERREEGDLPEEVCVEGDSELHLERGRHLLD